MIDVADDREAGWPLPKWYNSPVHFIDCQLPDAFQYLPDFERRTLAVQDADRMRSYLNPHLDTIVRKPFQDDPNHVPIGTVSKTYALVPHKETLRAAADGFAEVNIDPAGIRTKLAITEYGERMHASLFLPGDYGFNPGDGYRMALRLELFNSVDGTVRFWALMGWFRLVCSNGLVLGVTKSSFRRRHTGNLGVSGVAHVLREGLDEAEEDKQSLRQWRERTIDADVLVPWINKSVRETWGFKAAARAYHIACSGHDVEIAGKYKGRLPTTIGVRRTERVPGCPDRAGNAFDVSQVLSWLAANRRDIQEQLQWKQQIPILMASLTEE